MKKIVLISLLALGMTLLALSGTICSRSVLAQQNATGTEAPIVPNRILVIFNGNTLPSDAANRIAAAGGQMIHGIGSVGIAVVAPATAGGATLIRNLHHDPTILDADYDRVVELIAPAQVVADDAADVSPDMLPHPLPTFSTSLPPDFFYTSTPQQWPAKRLGAAGGGIATPAGDPTSGAWDVTFGAGAKIAILDTGVNPAHPDVKDNLAFNLALTSYDPASFGTPNCEVPDASNPPFDLPADQNGHGTWTSSLAAGEIGGGLLIGVAPRAKILNIKVLRNLAASPATLKANGLPDTPYNRCLLRNGSGFFSWVLEGMVVATLEGADVISMSLGGFVPRNVHGGATIASAFNRVSNFATAHGAIVFAAAGNSALNLGRIQAFIELPGQASGVIPVIATTNPALFPPTPPARQPCTNGADCLAFYSDFGTNLGGLSAPGGDLPSGGCAFSGSPCNPTGFVRGGCSSGLVGTVPPDPSATFGTGGPPAGTSFGCFSFTGLAQHAWYVQAIGTSASTPLAAGVAALVKSANPALSPAQIRTIMQQTAQDIGKNGYDALFNFGLADANAAVHKAIQ
ncbi:MAG TPA: S8 family serine peptidase [Candidatus Acidoferrum sp.]|nr:S8 family serine peptidase [Candidatus Acidoferrum sp.]